MHWHAVPGGSTDKLLHSFLSFFLYVGALSKHFQWDMFKYTACVNSMGYIVFNYHHLYATTVPLIKKNPGPATNDMSDGLHVPPFTEQDPPKTTMPLLGMHLVPIFKNPSLHRKGHDRASPNTTPFPVKYPSIRGVHARHGGGDESPASQNVSKSHCRAEGIKCQ